MFILSVRPFGRRSTFDRTVGTGFITKNREIITAGFTATR
jgi:hypothetical protein